jgi:kynurenine formamidase
MRVERIVDLSIVVDNDTQVYPGDPRPHLSAATTIEGQGFNVSELRLGSHSGTHVDAPYHFIAEGPVLEDTELSLLAGPGVIVDVTGHGPRQPITVEDLAPYEDRFGPGAVVALRTGWSDRFLGTDRYHDHPSLDPAACRRLLDVGVRTVAIDAMNLDETVLEGEASFPCHMAFLGAGGVFSENLTNLGAVDFDDPLLCLFPIRLGGDADGAPCRAVALKLAP